MTQGLNKKSWEGKGQVWNVVEDETQVTLICSFFCKLLHVFEMNGKRFFWNDTLGPWQS